MKPFEANLRRVYWETTAGCNLRCIHCRRIDVLTRADADELSTPQAEAFIRDLASMGKPVLIFSGGEPLMRRDIYDLIAFAKGQGLPVAISTNGTLVTQEIARKLRDAGIYYASISLDGATAETHDLFRGHGNFERAVRGMQYMQEVGIKVQVNFTVTKQNVHQMQAMYVLCRSLKAHALYLFLLVPVGCGIQIADSQMISAEEVDEWLGWVVQRDKEGPLPIKAICAPHYFRVEHMSAESAEPPAEDRKGCLAGIHMAFVSHKGDVYPCGYLPVVAGNIKEKSIHAIWNGSPEFASLRDPEKLEGICGRCSYKGVCGGCRARAFYTHQNILAEEPFCTHDEAAQPQPAAR
jgi:radical SAM protein with 4Fe4S-binding SPASM domain